MDQPMNPPLTFCSPPFGHVPLLDRLTPAAAADSKRPARAKSTGIGGGRPPRASR